MGLESTHPLYDDFKEDWCTLRDLSQGESVVKKKRERYLPPTPSMILDGFGKGINEVGEQTYNGYLQRAQFPDYIAEGIRILVGMLNFKETKIELPAAMEPLRESCTLSGESLLDLLRQMHVEQLTTGRLGLLADLPSFPNSDTTKTPSTAGTTLLPYIVMYGAESIRNWDEARSQDGLSALNLVLLDEGGFKRNDEFEWTKFKKIRVLQLGSLSPNEAEGSATYKSGAFSDIDGGSLTYDEKLLAEPMFRGKKLEEIPFVIVNTRDLLGTPDQAPLKGLGSLVLAIYRGEADYRQGLFMTGQDTLVVIGGTRNPGGKPGEEDALRVGAGSRIDCDINGDAKYIGVGANGLTEQRTCLENDHKRAATKSGQLLPTGKANSQESGEALKTRLAAQTASLTDIARTSARGLEVQLKSIATWIGANPEQVKVTANMEFGDLQLQVADILGLGQSRLTGVPISKKSIHSLLVEKRLTTMTFEEELEQIKEEDADMPRVAAGAATLTAEEQLAQQDAKNARGGSGAE
jgi:hypothetical protein